MQPRETGNSAPASLRLHRGRSAATQRGLQLLLPTLATLALLRILPARALALLPGCLIFRLTGLLCPGCGGTRALIAVLHGDLHGAWHLNPLLVGLAPFAVAYALAAVRRGNFPRLPTPAIHMLSLLILVFTIARNL